MIDSAPPAANTRRRYYTLDGLRGFAALMVAIYHLGQMTAVAVPHGYLAVDFFFMLSGFVIALNYQHRLEQEMSFVHFAKMRLIRVYPMFLLGLVLGVPERVLRASLKGTTAYSIADVPTFIANIFMLPSPFNYLLFPFNGALWSLFIEVIISLSFGALLYRASNRTLVVMILSAAAALIFVFVKPDDYIDMGWSWPTLTGGLTRAGFAFPLGMLICRWLSGVKFRETCFALLPFLTLGTVLVLSLAPRDPALADLIAVFLVLPLALAFGIAFEPPPPARRIFALLGDLSYPAYAIHSPLVILIVFVTAGSGLHSVTLFTVFSIVLCGTALMTARYLDRPTRAWLNKQLHLNYEVKAPLPVT